MDDLDTVLELLDELSASLPEPLRDAGAGCVTWSWAHDVRDDLGPSQDARPGVGVLTLDRAEHRNALTVAMMRSLCLAVRELYAWDGAVVVVRAAQSGSFCAGADLMQMGAGLGDRRHAETMSLAMTTILDGLLLAPCLSVSAIDGPAVGGGAELAFATDLRIMGPGGWLEFRQALLGVPTGWGGAARASVLLGHARAAQILCTGERVAGARALALGVVQAQSDVSLEDALDGVVEPLSVRSAEAIRGLKAQILTQRPELGAASRSARVREFVRAWGSQAQRERMGAAVSRHQREERRDG